MVGTRRVQLWAVALLLHAVGIVILPGCDRSEQAPRRSEVQGQSPVKMTVKSTAFPHDQAIPRRHTGDGKDVSPPLTWSAVPEGAKELALIVDDPDAPRAEPWVHWVIYKIPADVTALAEGVPTSAALTNPPGALQGKNSWGTVGYRGPLPPKGHGVHHYHFKLYALDAALEVKAGLDKQALLAAMSGHVLAEGELIGTYQR